MTGRFGMKDFTTTINGRRYRVVFKYSGNDNFGMCMNPSLVRRTITIPPQLLHPDRDKELLSIAIHEALHAADWDKDESWIENTAIELAHLLTKLGYQRTDE